MRRALLLPLVALAAATACTATDDAGDLTSASPTEAVRTRLVRAVSEAGDAETGRFTMSVSVEAGTLGDLTVTAEGAYDTAAGRSSMVATTEGGAGGPVAGEWKVVVDGDTTYVDLGPIGAVLGADGWVSFPSGPEADAATPAGPVDAAEVLDALGAVAEVSEVGPEEIDGVPTTRYSAVVDPARLGEGGDAGPGLVVSDAPVDVWVDAEGRLRRVSMRASAGAQGAVVDYEVTVDYLDLGEPVDIEVPDPSEVTVIDPSALVGGLGG